MIPDTLTTRSLRPREQLDAWRTWYGPVFEVTPKDAMGDGFLGETRLWQLGGLLISRTSAPPARVSRNKGHLRRDPTDHWVVSYCMRGAHSARTADTEVEVPARVPFLWSLGQEFLYERTHVDRVQIFWRAMRSAMWDLCSTPPAAWRSTSRSAASSAII
jgi:hypothetical protein